MKDISIRVKLLLSMIGLAFVLTAALSYIAYRSTYSEIESQLNLNVETNHRSMRQFLQMTADQVDQISMAIISNDAIQTAVSDVNRASDGISRYHAHRQAVENEFLEVTLGHNEIRAIYLLTDADVYFSLVVDPRVDVDAVTDADLAAIRQADGDPVWMSVDTKSMTISMGRVFVDVATQKPAGILVIAFRESYFSNVLQSSATADLEAPFLISADCHIVSHVDKDRVGRQLSDPDLLTAIASQSDFVGRQVVGGEERLVWSYAVPGFNWRLVRMVPVAYLQSPALALQKRMLAIGVLCWCGATIIALLISRSISKPVSRLVNSLTRFSDGEPPQKVKWTSNDEIGVMVNAYNEMLSNLERTQSELVTSEQEFRSIFLTAHEGIIRMDSGGRIQKANPAAAAMFGYADAEALLADQRAVTELLDIGPTQPRDFGEWLEIAKSKFHEGLPVVSAAPTRRYVALSVVEVVDADARYYNGILQDVTQRKEDEATKASLARQLQQSQKMESMGTLAGGIAHDFNNILSSILGYSELLEMDCKLDNEGAKYLNQVQLAGNRARVLVQQILNFSRPSNSQFDVFDVNGEVGEAMVLLRAALPTSIRIESRLCADALRVYGDATQIHQIMMNLMTNAAHAITDRSGTITVSTQRLAVPSGGAGAWPRELEPGSYVVVAVADTGEGIPADAMSSIFDPFYSTKPKDKGTGLGLSVVHGLVKNHGGAIQVESQVGVGTTFRIYLPESTDEHAASAADRATGGVPGQGAILLVDDERTLVDIGRRLLIHAGYSVSAMDRSEDALRLLTAAPDAVDLLIADMNMPTMDGLQLAAAVRRVAPDLPIIICTGYREQVSEERLRELKISLCLQKPLSYQSLTSAVATCLAMSR